MVQFGDLAVLMTKKIAGGSKPNQNGQFQIKS